MATTPPSQEEDFFLERAPKDTPIILYHASSGLFYNWKLSKLMSSPEFGKDVQSMEVPLSLSFEVKIKVDWDSDIAGHFWERAGIWRKVKLPTWVWRARIFRGVKTIYVLRKGCGLNVEVRGRHGNGWAPRRGDIDAEAGGGGKDDERRWSVQTQGTATQ